MRLSHLLKCFFFELNHYLWVWIGYHLWGLNLDIFSIVCIVSRHVVSLAWSPVNMIHFINNDFWFSSSRRFCLNVSFIIFIVSWCVNTFSRSPVYMVFFILNLLWFSCSRWLNLSLDIGCMLWVVCWSMVAFSWSPVYKVFFILYLLWFSCSWWLWFLWKIKVRFGLNKIAILESAFNPVEEITNKLSLFLFWNSFKKLRVHLLLEIFIHINFKMWL